MTKIILIIKIIYKRMNMVFLVKMNIANNYKRSNISTILLSLSFIMILFIGLFSILYTITFGYSLSPSISPYNSTTDTTKSITNHHQQQQITPEVKNFILNDIVNKSKAAIVVGFIDPNGTKLYSFGNISKANDIPVNGSTIFNIDSITKTFTTLVLADMVKQGIVNLNDPIEKYLPIRCKGTSIQWDQNNT